ncbi:MAG: hypothetical protein ACXABO_04500 [Promethearchaeota archaeon]
MEKKVKTIFLITIVSSIVILLISTIRILITPPPVGKTIGHYFFESFVGPFSATLALFACVMIWMTANSMGGVMGRGLTLYAIGTVLLFIGMLAFGLHGYDVIPGEETRLILRSCVLGGTVFFFLGSIVIANETLK